MTSQDRGAAGGEGQDEYGRADVNDVLNLIPLARSLGYVDMNNGFMHGHSGGGMQALLAVRRGIPVNAVAVSGPLTDLAAAGQERSGLADRVWGRLMPGYAERREAVLRERSAVEPVPGPRADASAPGRPTSCTSTRATITALR